MKRNTLLIILSTIAIALLIFSQFVWVQLLVKRDKERFEMELKQTMQSIVSFCLSKEISSSSSQLSFDLVPIDPSQIPPDAIIRGAFDTQNYQSDKNLGNFLVGSFAEDLLKENKIPLEPIDSLFREEFENYSEIAAYAMYIQKNDSIMRQLQEGDNAEAVLADSTIGAKIVIPLGDSGQYIFRAHVVFKPSVFTQQLRTVSLLSAVVIIVISLLVGYQLFRLKRKSDELTSHKKAVSGIVHDLKSPLAYVFTQLGLFEHSEPDIDKRKRFYTSKTRVKYLTDKIDILLSALKTKSSGALQLQPGAYPLTKRCDEIMEELRVIYRSKQINFSMEPSEEITVTADVVYFDSCVRNLLDNAVKYSGDTPVIRVTVKKNENNVHISFMDNGKGIGSKDRKKVFREFYRVDSVSSVKSHGVGLAFTKQIVRAHSGRILLDSAPGKGSVFTIILPR